MKQNLGCMVDGEEKSICNAQRIQLECTMDECCVGDYRERLYEQNAS